MTDTKRSSKALPLTKTMSLFLMLGFLATGCSSESDEANQAVNDTVKMAQTLEGSIGGDVAGFILAEHEQDLSEVSFKDKDGNTKTFADFEGKTVFVNLWATWCAPCRAEMPSIERLSQKMSGDDFAVVAISVDGGSSAKPLAFYDEIGLNDLPFYHDATIGVFNSFKKKSLALGLPATVILNKSGKVLGKLNGPAEWDHEPAIKLITAAIAAD